MRELWEFFSSNREAVLDLTVEHIWLVLAAVSIAVVLGIVLGLLSSYWVSSPVRWSNLFWSYALSRAPASLVASFLYVPSALTILIAWVWLREVPTALTVVGGAVAVLRVFIVNTWGRRRLPQAS